MPNTQLPSVTAKSRLVYLDALKILACFLVIVNHTNSRIFLTSTPSASWFVSLTYFFISKTAVPIFIMASGAVLLAKVDTYKKNFSRIFRMVQVLVTFSIFFYFYHGISAGRELSVIGFLRLLITDSTTVAYWYLYLYLGLLIMLPILQKTVKSFGRQDYLYFFLISIVFLGTFPILSHYMPFVRYNQTLSFPIFDTAIGLFVMGYFLNKENISKNIAKYSLACSVSFTLFSVILTYLEYAKNPDSYLFFDNRMFFTITGVAISLFCIFKYVFSKLNISEKVGKNISLIGRLTFGIYLLSDFLIPKTDFIYYGLSNVMPRLGAIVAQELAVFVIGGLITFLLIKLPVLRKIL